MKGAALAVAVACSAAASAFAQSNIVNADLQERPAGRLASTFESLAAEAGPIWIGYAVPAHDPNWNSCCYQVGGNGCCGRCSLGREDGEGSVSGRTKTPPSRVNLEPASILVFLRVRDRLVSEVRVFSESCEIDAGGRRLYWLTGVRPAESVALLAALASGRGSDARSGAKPVTNGALAALASHQEPAAIDVLVRSARSGSPHARGQALFWLAHRAGQKAVAAITDAIENDPETEVKTRAVFALSQLPADEGVPKLIEVARTHRNPKVRRQAFFWLGQSEDPRALSFFEAVLFATPRSPRR